MNTGCAIGVDLGGTKTAVALVDPEGAIVTRIVFPTEAELGFERAVTRLGDGIQKLLEAVAADRTPCNGIGIGCAGPVDPARGLINNPFTLSGWDRCDIVTPLRQRFAIPVCLENDADAALLGEAWCGAGRGADPIVMLTFGTGVGGAAAVQGRLVRGRRGEHPEIGHILSGQEGPRCYCGASGCLESLASGTAIAAAGQAAGFSSAREVFAASARHDSVAHVIVDRAAEAAAQAAWTLFHAYLPERLILGGGLMDDHFDLFAHAIGVRLAAATQFRFAPDCVVRAALGNNAGLVGAARLAGKENETLLAL